MLHLMKYTLKARLRNFNILFWPFLFPFAIGTLMYFAIGQMEEADFEIVPVAVVATQEQNDTFLTFLDRMTDIEEQLIQTERMTETEALAALERREIKGIFYAGEIPKLTVGGNGISETILESILQSYEDGKQTIERVLQQHPEGIKAAISKMKEYDALVEQVSLGGKTTNGNAQFFYALIGMACLYGCFIGFGSALDLQANLTPLAARRCVTPTHRLKLIIAEMTVSFGIHFANVLILLGYLKYILRLDFSGAFLKMLPVCCIGSMIGVTMGLFITSIGKMTEGIKIGILIGVSMICSFFAGLMNGTMKDLVERQVPFLNRINPAALISDALYCINVYDDPRRYVRNLVFLCVMCMLMVLGTFLLVRRERYDSI